MKKIISSLLLVLMLSPLFVSCSKNEDVDPAKLPAKSFELNGLSFTLTEGFEETVEGEQMLLRSSTIAAFVDRIDFSTMAGAADLPLLTYAKDYSTSAVEEDGLVLLEYMSSASTYVYFTAFYKGEHAFYILQFACRSEVYDYYRPSFLTWAKSAMPTA